MPPDPMPAGSPGDWLRHAHADLALAQAKVSPQLLELLCFHPQQAREKSLKAVLVHFGVPAPKTHNLRALLDSIALHCDVPSDIEACSELTDYAVTTRYPGVHESVTADEHYAAIQAAGGALRWAEGVIADGQSL